MQEKIIESLSQFTPYSVFLYGSRGRGDHKEDSDYEVGVIFKDDSYVERRTIHQRIQLDSVRIYPFKLSEIQKGILDTPFVNNIYLRELLEGGKTVYGKAVIETLTPPKITTLDLIRSTRFDIGYALAAILSNRSNDALTANEEFSKSCLFGLRSLIILKLNKFVCGYDEIYRLRNDVVVDVEHLKVIDAAYSLRQGAKNVDSNLLFDNLSFLDYVENEILDAFKSNDDSELA